MLLLLIGRVVLFCVIHTWSGGVIGRSREGRRRGRRVLRAAVQQLEELQGAGKLPGKRSNRGVKSLIDTKLSPKTWNGGVKSRRWRPYPESFLRLPASESLCGWMRVWTALSKSFLQKQRCSWAMGSAAGRKVSQRGTNKLQQTPFIFGCKIFLGYQSCQD